MNAIELESRYSARNYEPLPVVLARGEGANVWDTAGRRYIDMMSAYSAASHGHAHPRILAALDVQGTDLSAQSSTSAGLSNANRTVPVEQLLAPKVAMFSGPLSSWHLQIRHTRHMQHMFLAPHMQHMYLAPRMQHVYLAPRMQHVRHVQHHSQHKAVSHRSIRPRMARRRRQPAHRSRGSSQPCSRVGAAAAERFAAMTTAAKRADAYLCR